MLPILEVYYQALVLLRQPDFVYLQCALRRQAIIVNLLGGCPRLYRTSQVDARNLINDYLLHHTVPLLSLGQIVGLLLFIKSFGIGRIVPVERRTIP